MLATNIPRDTPLNSSLVTTNKELSSSPFSFLQPGYVSFRRFKSWRISVDNMLEKTFNQSKEIIEVGSLFRAVSSSTSYPGILPPRGNLTNTTLPASLDFNEWNNRVAISASRSLPPRNRSGPNRRKCACMIDL